MPEYLTALDKAVSLAGEDAWQTQADPGPVAGILVRLVTAGPGIQPTRRLEHRQSGVGWSLHVTSHKPQAASAKPQAAST